MKIDPKSAFAVSTWVQERLNKSLASLCEAALISDDRGEQLEGAWESFMSLLRDPESTRQVPCRLRRLGEPFVGDGAAHSKSMNLMVGVFADLILTATRETIIANSGDAPFVFLEGSLVPVDAESATLSLRRQMLEQIPLDIREIDSLVKDISRFAPDGGEFCIGGSVLVRVRSESIVACIKTRVPPDAYATSDSPFIVLDRWQQDVMRLLTASPARVTSMVLPNVLSKGVSYPIAIRRLPTSRLDAPGPFNFSDPIEPGRVKRKSRSSAAAAKIETQENG
jgi:hypothetical protein